MKPRRSPGEPGVPRTCSLPTAPGPQDKLRPGSAHTMGRVLSYPCSSNSSMASWGEAPP